MNLMNKTMAYLINEIDIKINTILKELDHYSLLFHNVLNSEA